MRTVLIVDDDDDIREVGQLALEVGSEWRVIDASSGVQALATAKANSPDAILLDVMMPGMDGPATFASLRSDPATRDIPVIFLTAKVRTSEREQLVALGAAGVLAKPFDPIILADQIAETLGWMVTT